MTNIKNLENLDVTILDTFIYDDEARLSKFNSDVNGEKLFLDDVTIQYTIKVQNKEFLIAFQPTERNDLIQAYSKVDFSRATFYGYESDESDELLDFLNDKNEDEKGFKILEVLESMADEEGRKIHANLEAESA